MRTRTIRVKFGKNTKCTHFGRKGCSHGMYSRGGYNYYIYGIKYIFNILVYEGWGDMSYPHPLNLDFNKKKKS